MRQSAHGTAILAVASAAVVLGPAPILAQESTEAASEMPPALPEVMEEKQRLLDMGRAHQTAWDLYRALQVDAGGGQQPPPFDHLPDWSGLWSRAPDAFVLFQPEAGEAPQFTPAAQRMLAEGRERTSRGNVYDEGISDCGPPGFPRWLVIPFLREFIVRPEQTWLSSETVNNVRRIYTDGRSHPDEAERYPLYYGDSIGFWDEGKLVIHTNQLMARYMGRNNLYQSDAIETVEVWETVAEDRIEVDAWIYDPSILEEPWHTKVVYNRIPNPDRSLRVRYWHCTENPNNEVYETEEGGTQFTEFLFEAR